MSTRTKGGSKTPRGPKRRFQHHFPVELYDRLEEAAEARGVSMALLVNRAVEHYLVQLPPAPPPPEDGDAILEQATAALRGGL